MSFLLRSLLPRRRGGEDSEDGGSISFGTKRASGCICFLRLYALSERTVRQKDPFPLGVERGGVLYRGTARLGRRSRGRCGLRERVFCGSDRAAFIDEARKIPLRRRFLPVSLPAFQFGGLPAFRSGDGGQLDDGCRFSASAVRLRAGVSVYNVSQYKKRRVLQRADRKADSDPSRGGQRGRSPCRTVPADGPAAANGVSADRGAAFDPFSSDKHPRHQRFKGGALQRMNVTAENRSEQQNTDIRKKAPVTVYRGLFVNGAADYRRRRSSRPDQPRML